MVLLPALGEPVAGQDDVEGILADQRLAAQQITIGGLLEQQTAPQVLDLVRHPNVREGGLLKP